MSPHSLKSEYDAIVVGSGPNGLACAIELARNKLSVLIVEKENTAGGGLKTQALTLPSFRHDVCSSVYPLAIASPFFKKLPLDQHGLEWIHSPAVMAHPFADGSVALLHRSIETTADSLGPDAEAYRKLFAPAVSDFDALMEDILAPPFHFPKSPLIFGKFGVKSVVSAKRFALKHFKTEPARALFMGSAAHACSRLTGAASAAVGYTLQTVGHGSGWPIPKGGARALADSLISYFQSLGGEIATGVDVREVESLPKSALVFFDLTPQQILTIAGKKLKKSIASSFEKFRYGPGVFKLDWALGSPVPWTHPETALAATIHLGNTASEIIRSEACVNDGTVSDQPFVLMAQPTLFDQTRAPSGNHIAWAYCHVPHGSKLDRTEAIENQIERFAPGFKKTILARSVMFPSDLESRNANLIGGDISGGQIDAEQLLFRPRITLHPYELDSLKYWICSSSAPPGPGVHGMCGYRAAQAALKSRAGFASPRA